MKNNRFTARIGISAILVLIAVSSTACSKIWDVGASDGTEVEMSKTGIGAATGAVIGAGVGAIVGSASGNAGEGLVLGSLAGAATGGAVGHHLETQDEILEDTQERLRRQDELIERQQRELEDLRNDRSDSIGMPGQRDSAYAIPPSNRPSSELYSQNVSAGGSVIPSRRISDFNRSSLDKKIAPARVARTPQPGAWREVKPEPVVAELPTVRDTRVREQELDNLMGGNALPPATKPTSRARVETIVPPATKVVGTPTKQKTIEKKEVRAPLPKKTIIAVEPRKPREPREVVEQTQLDEKPLESKPEPTARVAKTPDTPGCNRAADEASRALKAGSDADRLFYFRRAIRLCPESAEYHVAIGKVYAEIGRAEDARYEFGKALDLDPDNVVAKEQLSLLEGSSADDELKDRF